MDENHNVNPQKPSGVLSIVCGILSLVLAFFGYSAIIGFILAIIATVSGNNCKRAGGSIAGLVLGILGLVFNVTGFFVSCLVCGTLFGTSTTAMMLSY